MADKRFNVVASTTELIIVPEKTALRVELQYGKDGEPAELVIAELYWKDSAWAYTRSQVRVACNVTNAKHLIDSVKAMFEASKKVVKTEKKPDIESAIEKMTEAEKLALLALLSGKTAKAEAKPAEKKSSAKSDAELVLESYLTAKKPTTKKKK